MDRERIDRWCEWGIFGLTLLALVFASLALGAVRSQEFIYVEGATIFIGLLWLIRLWTKPVFEIFWPPVCWPVLAFLIYAFARYFTADIEFVARLELIRVCVYTVLFLSVVNNLQRQEHLKIFTWTFILLGAAVAIYAMYQFGTQSKYVWHFAKPEQYVHRGSGTLINPNHLAGFLEIILPIGIATVLFGRISHVTKIIFTYACTLILIGIGVSLSRGGWISTGVTVLCFVVASIIRTKSRWIIVSVVLLSFVTLAIYLGSSLQFQNRFQRTFAGGKVEDARFDYWKPAVQMWKEHLWIGVGPGHFDQRFSHYRPREVQARPQFAHNDYLNTVADWGVAGAILIIPFVVLTYLGLTQGLKGLRRKRDAADGKSNRVAFLFGAGFSLLAILLHSVTDFNMQIPGNAMLVLVVIAFAAGQLRFEERFWTHSRWIVGLPFTVVLVSLIAFLSIYGTRKARENFWLARAKDDLTLNGRVSSLEKAVRIEPGNFGTMTEIGDLLRADSFRGESGYEASAEKAIEWYRRAISLNPYSPYNYIGLGMCLDWLGRTKEATPVFGKALEVDPNSSYVVAYQGWHCVNMEQYQKAREWFDKSNQIQWNQFAVDYLDIIRQKADSSAPPRS